MIGAMGLGAIIGGLALRRLQNRFPPRLLIALMMALYAVSSIAIARTNSTTIVVARPRKKAIVIRKTRSRRAWKVNAK